MANAVRFCMTEEDHSGPNAFHIARPSIFGNPYTHIKNKETKALKKVKSRHEAVRLYDKYFDEMLKVNEDFRKAFDGMYEAFKTYEVIYVGCWCHLNEECHGDIIIKKLNQRLVKEKLKEIRNGKKEKEKDPEPTPGSQEG